jgi:hypothetical protein
VSYCRVCVDPQDCDSHRIWVNHLFEIMIVAFYSDMHGLGDLARRCFHPTLSRQWGRVSMERKILSRNFSRAARRDSIYRFFLTSSFRKSRR